MSVLGAWSTRSFNRLSIQTPLMSVHGKPATMAVTRGTFPLCKACAPQPWLPTGHERSMKDWATQCNCDSLVVFKPNTRTSGIIGARSRRLSCMRAAKMALAWMSSSQ